MPVVLCSFCEYVGSSKGKYRNLQDEFDDVIKHEKECHKKGIKKVEA